MISIVPPELTVLLDEYTLTRPTISAAVAAANTLFCVRVNGVTQHFCGKAALSKKASALRCWQAVLEQRLTDAPPTIEDLAVLVGFTCCIAGKGVLPENRSVVANDLADVLHRLAPGANVFAASFRGNAEELQLIAHPPVLVVAAPVVVFDRPVSRGHPRSRQRRAVLEVRQHHGS